MMTRLKLWLHLAIVAIMCDCTPSPGEAAVAYGSDLDACVAQGTTRQEVDACRSRVNATWSVVDGGAAK
jgi:hypothetical protein